MGAGAEADAPGAAAERTTALLRDTLQHAPSLVAAQADHQATIHPILTWAREELTVDPEAFAPWGLAQKNRSRDGDCEFLHADQYLYANYSEFCATHGMQRLASTKFQSGLLDLLRVQLHLDVVPIRCKSGAHRDRHGLRGVRLAQLNDPPLVPDMGPVGPDAAPVGPVGPTGKTALAPVSTGSVKEWASGPVGPVQTFSTVSRENRAPDASATPVVSPPSSETLDSSLTGALAQLAQKEEKKEVRCASPVFETGATGATGPQAGASAALATPAPSPVSTAASLVAMRELLPLETLAPGWRGWAPAMAKLIAVPVAYLLKGRLTDPEWEQMVEANVRLYASYPQRRADLAALIQAIDQVTNPFTGESS